MIPARKNRFFGALFVRDARGRLARSFEGVYVRGLTEARAIVRAHPVICISNHVSWWDALVALVLSEDVLAADGYALMDANNLARLPFFSLVGAIGVDRKSSMDGARAARHAATVLTKPGRLLWIFAQGRERAATLRPLAFEPGAASVARMVPAAKVLPVSFRYEPGPTPLPRLFIDFGDVMTSDVSPATAEPEARETKAAGEKKRRNLDHSVREQERAVEVLLDRSALTLASEDLSSYERLFSAKPSALQPVLEWTLAVLTRPFTRVPSRS